MPDKPPLPEGFEGMAADAEGRLCERSAPPRVGIERAGDGWRFVSPYAKDDAGCWFVLLCDAFGTRHGGVMEHFLNTLVKLVPEQWDADRQYWVPVESDFNAVLAIVSSVRPENEAQAALAAQLAALHMSAMRLGAHTASYADARTTAILNKTVRAYGDGIERLARLQGKVRPRSIHQTFEVHKHEHVHFEGGGGPNGGQGHAAECCRINTPARTARSETSVGCAALPSPHPLGQSVRLPCGKGKAGLPNARWLAWFRRSFWRS